MKNYKIVIAYLVVTLLVVGLIPTGRISYASFNGDNGPVYSIDNEQEELLITNQAVGTQAFTRSLTTNSFTDLTDVSIVTPSLTGITVDYDNAGQVTFTLTEDAIDEYFEIILYDSQANGHKIKVWVDYYFRNYAMTERDHNDINMDDQGLRVMYYDLNIPEHDNTSGDTYHDTFGIQKYPVNTVIVKEPSNPIGGMVTLMGMYWDMFNDTSNGDASLYYTFDLGNDDEGDELPDNNRTTSDSGTVTENNPYFQGTYNWGYFVPRYSGKYVIGTYNDDGVDITMQDNTNIGTSNTNKVVDWVLQAPNETLLGVQEFTAGKAYPIDVAFYENHRVKVSFVLLYRFDGKPGFPVMTSGSYYDNKSEPDLHPDSLSPIPTPLLFPADGNRSPEHGEPVLIVDPTEESILFGSEYDMMHGVTTANGTLVTEVKYEITSGTMVTVGGVNTHQLGKYIIYYTLTSWYDENVVLEATREVTVIPDKEYQLDYFVYFIGDQGTLVKYFPFLIDSDTGYYGVSSKVENTTYGYNQTWKFSSIGTLNNGRVVGIKHHNKRIFIDIDTDTPEQLTWAPEIQIKTNAMTIDHNNIMYMIKNGSDDDENSYIHRFQINQKTNEITDYGNLINIGEWYSLGDIEVNGDFAYILARNDNEKIRVLIVNLLNGDITKKNVDIDDDSYGLANVLDYMGNTNFMLFGNQDTEVKGLGINPTNNKPYDLLTMFNPVMYLHPEIGDLEDAARGIPRGETNIVLNDLTLYETQTGEVYDPSSVLAGYEISYALTSPSMSSYLYLNPDTGYVQALEYYPDPIEITATLHDGYGTTETCYVTIHDLYYTLKVTGPTEVSVPDLTDPSHPMKYVEYGYEFMNQLGDTAELIDPVWMITTQSAMITTYEMTTSPSTNMLIVPSTGESEYVYIDVEGEIPEGLDPVESVVPVKPIDKATPLLVNITRDEEFVLTITGKSPVYIPPTAGTISATEMYLSNLEDNFGTDFSTANREFWTLILNPDNPGSYELFYTDPDDPTKKYYKYDFGRISITTGGMLEVQPYVAGVSYETGNDEDTLVYIGADYPDEGVRGVLGIEVIKDDPIYTLEIDTTITELIIPLPTQPTAEGHPFNYILSDQYDTGLSLVNPVWSYYFPITGVSIPNTTTHTASLHVENTAEAAVTSGNSTTVTITVKGDQHPTPVGHDVTLIRQITSMSLTIIGEDEIQIPMTGSVAEDYSYTYVDEYGSPRILEFVKWTISDITQGVTNDHFEVTVTSDAVPHMAMLTLTGIDAETGYPVGVTKPIKIMPKQIIPTLTIQGASQIVIPGTIAYTDDAVEEYEFFYNLQVPVVTYTQTTLQLTGYETVLIPVPTGSATMWALSEAHAGVTAVEVDGFHGTVTVTSGTQTGDIVGIARVIEIPMSDFIPYDVYPDDYDLQASKDIELVKDPMPSRLAIEGADSLLIPRFYDPDTESIYVLNLYDQYDELIPKDSPFWEEEWWWNLATSYTGISFDQDTGLIVVDESATSIGFMINAWWGTYENGDNGSEGDRRGPDYPLDADKTVNLDQLPIDYYDLNINIVGSGSVAVDPEPDEEMEGYMHGTVVDLVPTAGPGFSFAGFSAPVSGNQITMDNTYTITATFTADEEPPTPTVNLTINVVGDGTVSPGSANFAVGTVVQLAFTPAEGWEFASVTGPVDGNNQITMDTDYAITVTFDEVIDIPDEETPLAAPTTSMYTLDVYVVGQGTVTPNFGVYSAGSIATFTPTPAEGWEFTGYNINAIQNNQLVMDQDYIVVAIFEEIVEIPEDEVPLADLPQTGGIGQLFFYLFGGLMMLLGAALFMRRDRSHN